MYSIPFGDDFLKFSIPFKSIDVIKPVPIKPSLEPENIVQVALNNPVNSKQIGQMSDFAGKKVAIAINDQTRPLPHRIILPQLLDLLAKNGIKKEDIIFFISTGTHRELTSDEVKTVLPDNLSNEYSWKCHKCDDESSLTYIGYTSMRTQVYINRDFYQSDLKIVVGNIEPHHFMGFSGGMKTAAIGLTGRVTIEKNHAMMVTNQDTRLGIYLENPMRQDVEEIGRMIGVEYALNVVMNDNKQVIAAFWGEPTQVMKAGIPVALKASQLDIRKEDCGYDLVIASVGGYPKDINLHQSQKALTNACLFSRENGVIILAAECRNGPGNKDFDEFMQNKQSWQQVFDVFSLQPFKIGPHKAYLLARQAIKHKIILVSSMPDDVVRKFLLTPAADIPEAINLAVNNLPANPRVALLPYATHSMPIS